VGVVEDVFLLSISRLAATWKTRGGYFIPKFTKSRHCSVGQKLGRLTTQAFSQRIDRRFFGRLYDVGLSKRALNKGKIASTEIFQRNTGGVHLQSSMTP